MLLRPLCLPLNISQWQKVSPRANRLHECGSTAARSDMFGCWRTGQRAAEAEAEPVVRSCQCFFVIPHLAGWTNRLSELISPWERPTALLIHISVLFPYIPVISSCTRGNSEPELLWRVCICGFSSPPQVKYAHVNCS